MSTRNPMSEFLAAMAARGIVPTTPIQPDGTIQRFHVKGEKPGTRNGWAVLFCDGIPAGRFGNWKTGESATWSAVDFRDLSTEDRAAQLRRLEQARAEAAAIREREHAEAAGRAVSILERARPASPSHPYLIRKAVEPWTAMQDGADLALRVQDFDGRTWSVQFIRPDGGKQFMPGGRIGGCFVHVAGDLDRPAEVRIAEGFATAATLATSEQGATVLAALNAGNLRAVAVEARRRWPSARIVICGDVDPVGEQKARAAAFEAGALVAFPTFPPGASGTDFNDLAACLREGGAV